MGSIVFFAVILLFVVLEVVAIRRMKGVWRWLACVPIAALVVIIAIIVISVIYDPTSHNLWPLEILIWSAGGCIFLGALFGLKALVER